MLDFIFFDDWQKRRNNLLLTQFFPTEAIGVEEWVILDLIEILEAKS